MTPESDRTLETVLNQAGFQQGNCRAPGLIGPSEVDHAPDIYLRYGPIFNAPRQKNRIADLVYEIPSNIDGVAGTPSICFKVLDDATPALINSIRMQIWNHGRVPTLWIISPDSVRIYDSFARPQANDHHDSSNHLLEELSQIGSRLQGIENFHKSKFDTGEFWQSGKGQAIEPSQRVDSALLRDLIETKRALELEGLDPDVAQNLLGRTIFIKYLEDRQILGPLHFKPFSSQQDFRGMLHDTSTTYCFFQWLRATFDGDLFPLRESENTTVTCVHLNILSRFLSGHDMSRYPNSQARLWPYSFETIPIELISSIYELFAHTTNEDVAETTSIHYTRFNLVELVLSLVMNDIPHTARVLDPACGSGVFLVEAFRRLARLKSKHHGRPLSREELHQILISQIFGIDIDQQAVYVAAFSLYLALLELDPDPQPPAALRLPRLIDPEPPNNRGANLHIQDFFNHTAEFNRSIPFLNHDLDLIVGNPPWTALKSKPPRESRGQPTRQWAIEYCQHNDIPDNKPDQAFAWRAREFSSRETRIALIMASRLLYQGSSKGGRWTNRFLATNQILHVVNLSDLRKEQLLFGRGSSTSQPASVITFRPKRLNSHASFLHIAPKWYPGIRQRDELIINSVDIQQIPQDLFRQYRFLRKTAFRGTPRDFHLLQRLGSLPTLADVLLQANIRKRLDRSYGVTFGAAPTEDASALQGLPYLAAGEHRPRASGAFRYVIDVCDLPVFTRPHIAKKSIKRPLPLPALILHRALREQRPCAALIEPSGGRRNIVLHRYYGISLARATGDFGYRLNAILNSDLATYLLFFLSSSLAWECDVLEAQDWMRMPLPPTILEEGASGAWKTASVHEKWLRTHSTDGSDTFQIHESEVRKRQLDAQVLQLYELSDQERVLVTDTLRYTIRPFLRGNEHRAKTMLEKPTIEQLRDYTSRLCSQLNGILRQASMQVNGSVIVADTIGLNACRFAWQKDGDDRQVPVLNVKGIDGVLDQMSIALRTTVAERLYLQQDLRVYDDHAFWIIKPSQARLWSETAALHDADAVLREHMDWPVRG